jgi:tetratricopeptide (TPR) repeat protein
MKRVDFSEETDRPYGELLWEMARRMKAVGRQTEAVGIIEIIAGGNEPGAMNGDLYVHLGDWAVEKKDWTEAAKDYEKAWKKDRTQALPLYLQGWALEKAGHVAEGRDRMALAHLLPVGDEVRRVEFVRGLFVRNLEDAGAGEADILIRTGDPLSTSSLDALRMAGEHADARGDFAVASALWQRSVADYLTTPYWFVNHAQYLHLPNTVRTARAKALIDAGDFDAADREIKISLQLLPTDSAMVLEVVPELEKHGRKAEADALFSKMFAVQQELCDRYPQSAWHLNEYAWLAAKCHRELDKALTAAKRAVPLDLEPRPVAEIDTLAEVYFQRGEFAEAIAEEKKCVDLCPDVPFHRQQLEKFEAAAKKVKE